MIHNLNNNNKKNFIVQWQWLSVLSSVPNTSPQWKNTKKNTFAIYTKLKKIPVYTENDQKTVHTMSGIQLVQHMLLL